MFLEFLTIKPAHEFEHWKETQKKRIETKKYIFLTSHASLIGGPSHLPEYDSSLPGMQILEKAVDHAKTLVMGSQQQAIQEAFGLYYIEALDMLKEPDFKQFEEFLISLNSVYMRIVSEMEGLLQTELSKASNYEQLSFSFGQLKRFNV